MDNEDREEIFKAIQKAIEAFENELLDWNIIPPIRIEVREIRNGDFSLGESIVVDRIKEELERIRDNNE